VGEGDEKPEIVEFGGRMAEERGISVSF